MAPPDPNDTAAPISQDTVSRAFGVENRARLLRRYFDQAGHVTTVNAWEHVYRLLLWIDRTTALAHCYESDKSQPGRPWYGRSLAFHDWVSRSLHVSPAHLAEHIDWLFKEAVRDLAGHAVRRQAAQGRETQYQQQRAPYDGQHFPEPGEDPELVAIIQEALRPWLRSEPPAEKMRELTRRIYAHLTQENKRKNLVGEGFEDVLAALLTRLPSSAGLQIKTRTLLHEIPGFHAPPPNEKAKKVDLSLVSGSARTLVSAKWSIRADREEQFESDFQAYARLESAGRDFEYVLITNEFDAARLKAACERRRQNAPLFTQVVHINPQGVLVAYEGGVGGSADVLRTHVASGRLLSLEAWLERLNR